MKKVRLDSKIMLIGCFVTLLVMFYWAWLFYMTEPATGANTYKCCETIIDVEIHLASHRGSDKLYIMSPNHCYMLNIGWRNENKSYELAENILSGDQNYTITVWKHISKSLFDIRGNSVQVHQVADMRNDGDIYWNIEDHNNFQKSERIAGVIAGIFLSVITVIFDILLAVGTRGRFA